jgi:hypothetical protein
MKHFTNILFASLLVAGTAGAQAVTDTISVGAGYANQVWYSLQNDVQGSSAKNNWDIAFDVTPFGASVLANTITGTTVWLYAAGDTADWNSVDTSGLSTWPKYFNSDTSWALGAFNQGATANAFDMGWGFYNSTTHYVTGDSIYIVKLSNNSYRKLWIQFLGSGAYTFRYSNLDNSADQTQQIVKADYSGKNFGYYSLQNNAALNREPASADWDLLFSQYTAFIPTAYTVTGVLSNIGTTVAKASGVDTGSVQWAPYQFVTPMNQIGYDWKALNMSTFQYDITDSLAYFVQVQNGDIWKVIFTGFGGSANGNYIFTKELVSLTGMPETEAGIFMELYPNPAQDNARLTFAPQTNSPVRITVMDMTGKLVYDVQQSSGPGMQQHTLEVSGWNAGMYMVAVQCDGKIQHRKLIVR